MTLAEAISQSDAGNPNLVPEARKIEWLSRLDQWIWDQVISRHEKGEDTPESYEPYDENSGDTELLAPSPFDEMYIFYLDMQVQRLNQEYDKYNNSAVLYASMKGQYTRDYQRRHMPLRGIEHHQF